jgi:5'-phosphate synthase pdxT subunit
VAGNTPRIGVLALQGGVAEHEAMLSGLGADTVQVRGAKDLEGLDGLVLPGGESSVMDKLLRLFEMREPLQEAIRAGLPVLGTCAGLILLADVIEGAIPGQQTLGGLDVTVVRNAFGSQVVSHEATIEVAGIDGPPLEVLFIRAPAVTRVGAGVRVIATMADGGVVGVATETLLGVAFHPEVSGDNRLHKMFLHDMVRPRAGEGTRR